MACDFKVLSPALLFTGAKLEIALFSLTFTGGLVSGDTGNDTITLNGKISGGTLIDGGSDDDLITLNERITSSTVLGGAAQDTTLLLTTLRALLSKLVAMMTASAFRASTAL